MTMFIELPFSSLLKIRQSWGSWMTASARKQTRHAPSSRKVELEGTVPLDCVRKQVGNLLGLEHRVGEYRQLAHLFFLPRVVRVVVGGIPPGTRLWDQRGRPRRVP